LLDEITLPKSTKKNMNIFDQKFLYYNELYSIYYYHLHFELIKDGKYVNPDNYYDKKVKEI